ncbi:MAG: hypothetical protein JWN56_100 [Sphingobacteriales bacterium]|nr:hypothetical protein [Sphingobacteriales bacterium]
MYLSIHYKRLNNNNQFSQLIFDRWHISLLIIIEKKGRGKN